jgi:hypothetical protein
MGLEAADGIGAGPVWAQIPQRPRHGLVKRRWLAALDPGEPVPAQPRLAPWPFWRGQGAPPRPGGDPRASGPQGNAGDLKSFSVLSRRLEVAVVAHPAAMPTARRTIVTPAAVHRRSGGLR